MHMVTSAFGDIFNDNANLLLAMLVFLAAGTLAFSAMAFARVRGSVKRRATNLLDESERGSNSKRSLRYSSLKAVTHLLEYTTKHYSATNDENMRVLRQRMVDARLAARMYTREHGEDDPAIAGWTWGPTERNETVS